MSNQPTANSTALEATEATAPQPAAQEEIATDATATTELNSDELDAVAGAGVAHGVTGILALPKSTVL